MKQIKTKSFHSSLVRHPKCTYWGVADKSSYFQFSNKEQTLTIRFDDMPWQFGIVDGPSFINAELNCNRTGDMIEYTTIQTIAKRLLKHLEI
jgi:hypothetical protein